MTFPCNRKCRGWGGGVPSGEFCGENLEVKKGGEIFPRRKFGVTVPSFATAARIVFPEKGRARIFALIWVYGTWSFGDFKGGEIPPSPPVSDFIQEHRNRWFMAVSLAEAETIRRILHIRSEAPSLFPEANVGMALRCLPAGYNVMDSTRDFLLPSFPCSPQYQLNISHQVSSSNARCAALQCPAAPHIPDAFMPQALPPSYTRPRKFSMLI